MGMFLLRLGPFLQRFVVLGRFINRAVWIAFHEVEAVTGGD